MLSTFFVHLTGLYHFEDGKLEKILCCLLRRHFSEVESSERVIYWGFGQRVFRALEFEGNVLKLILLIELRRNDRLISENFIKLLAFATLPFATLPYNGAIFETRLASLRQCLNDLTIQVFPSVLHDTA